MDGPKDPEIVGAHRWKVIRSFDAVEKSLVCVAVLKKFKLIYS